MFVRDWPPGSTCAPRKPLTASFAVPRAAVKASTPGRILSGRFVASAANKSIWVHGPKRVSASVRRRARLAQNALRRINIGNFLSIELIPGIERSYHAIECVSPLKPCSAANHCSTGTVPGSTGETTTGSRCHAKDCPSRICKSPRHWNTLQKFNRTRAWG